MTAPAPEPAAQARAEVGRMDFEYIGVIVPYVRVGQERWTPRARQYFASKDNLGLAFKLQMRARGMEPIPEKMPFALYVTFRRRNLYTCDLDNLEKAVLDAMQGIVFPDDRYCVHVEADKERGVTDWFAAAVVCTEVID